MTDTTPFCFSCYVSQLQLLANELGHQLQPVIPETMNLPTEYHEQLEEIDQLPCQYTLVALKEVIDKLLEIGMEAKSERGNTKMISYMRQTVNLINLLTSISGDI